MATKNVPKIPQLFSAWITSASNDLSSNETCWFSRLPPEIFQTITDFLSTKDLYSLSQTCQSFYIFLNDNNFWIHRIHCQFPPSVVQLYTHDLFNKPETIQIYNEIRQSGFTHIQTDSEFDILAINSATHYNDEAIEKRHAKMYVSKEDFLTNLEFFQFNKPTNYSEIPFMKLIYFYLIDRKRCATVDMNVIHRNEKHLIEESDEDSLAGRIIHLERVCWLEITGRFEHKLMPGNYAVSWRMKGSPNDIHIWGETEFIVLPQHGKLLNYRMTDDTFQALILEHGSQWFTVRMGQTAIYQPSTVLMAIRNWNNRYWKCGLSWDCIELILVP